MKFFFQQIFVIFLKERCKKKNEKKGKKIKEKPCKNVLSSSVNLMSFDTLI
jgi:hypothetical protein